MIPFEQEPNLEVLRQYAILFRDAAKHLASENARLKGSQSEEAQEFLNARLRNQLSRLRQKFFGFGREELKSKGPRPLGHKQQKLRLHGKRLHIDKESQKSS